MKQTLRNPDLGDRATRHGNALSASDTISSLFYLSLRITTLLINKSPSRQSVDSFGLFYLTES